MIFPSVSNKLIKPLPWVNDNLPLRYRFMKKRWGSCSARGQITLNPHLIKSHPQCIDYVILHELCHLKELNHSPRFYALMDKYMPQWRDLKTQLNEMSGDFFLDVD